MPATQDPEVGAVFASAPPEVRRRLLELRELIHSTAEQTDGVGALEETLRWGQPAYLTSETGSGTTIRLGWKPSAPTEVSLLVHCGTTLVSDLRPSLEPTLQFEGNRAVTLPVDQPVPTDALCIFVEAALTYHQRKQARGLSR